VVREAITEKRLIRLLPDWRSILINYYVLYLSRRGLTKKSEAFINYFTEKFREEAKP